MAMAERDVSKLPKWGQRLVEELKIRIAELERSVADLSNEHPGSNVVLRGRNHTDPDIGLRPDSTVFFYAGGRNPLTNMIEVRHDHNHPNRLHIASYGSRGLRIITASGNAFFLEMEDR